MQESTVTAKGQTTVPRQVRKALGLRPGDRLRYQVLGEGEVRIARTRSAASLSGSLKVAGPAVSLEAMEAAIAEGAAGE